MKMSLWIRNEIILYRTQKLNYLDNNAKKKKFKICLYSNFTDELAFFIPFTCFEIWLVSLGCRIRIPNIDNKLSSKIRKSSHFFKNWPSSGEQITSA